MLRMVDEDGGDTLWWATKDEAETVAQWISSMLLRGGDSIPVDVSHLMDALFEYVKRIELG